VKGTRISVMMARVIAAELRAAIADAEKREVERLLAFERDAAGALRRAAQEKVEESWALATEVSLLKKKLRQKSRRKTTKKDLAKP
jgi:regulator of replication initiation timing